MEKHSVEDSLKQLLTIIIGTTKKSHRINFNYQWKSSGNFTKIPTEKEHEDVVATL